MSNNFQATSLPQTAPLKPCCTSTATGHMKKGILRQEKSARIKNDSTKVSEIHPVLFTNVLSIGFLTQESPI